MSLLVEKIPIGKFWIGKWLVSETDIQDMVVGALELGVQGRWAKKQYATLLTDESRRKVIQDRKILWNVRQVEE